MDSVKERLSAFKARLKTFSGSGGGFFTAYDYVDSIKPVSRPYPEIMALCEASPFRDFVVEMASHIAAFKAFGEQPSDPSWQSTMLSPLDGAALYTAVRKFRPRHIIEIGSGDSTHFIAKAGDGARITCIDPAPRRAIEHLPVSVVPRVLTDDDADLCATLEPNDILFIDSSHILLPGMDVDIELNRIFPRLKPGVIVHVHDIFLPFDYPPHWKGRNWNEQGALVGWLFGGFEIVYPGHYVGRCHPELLDQTFGDFPMPKNAGSMWLRKRRA